MCPYSQIQKEKTHPMTEKLFQKIIKEIIDTRHIASVDLTLQNEPFLDPELLKKIQYIKKNQQNKISTIVKTNGSLLTDDRLRHLIESNLDILVCSIDAWKKETYEQIRKGLSYDTIITAIDTIQHSPFAGEIYVQLVRQKANSHEINEFKKGWRKKGITPKVINLSNRGGILNNYDDLTVQNTQLSVLERCVPYLLQHLVGCCFYPLNWFHILSNGDVILCCNDYEHKHILGNVNDSTIQEIWNSPAYQKIRHHFKKGEYNAIPICRDCYIWKNYYV
jgi:radical SAM protein with 4Fe4S-binding SPASM domain